MKKTLAAISLAAMTAGAASADASPVYSILCQKPGNNGSQWLEAYPSAPNEMTVWYNAHAHIKIFEPLVRGTPIVDNVMTARIRSLGMTTHYHTVANYGYATMVQNDFLRVFNTGAYGHGGTPINGWHCTAGMLVGNKPRIIPFDPRGFTP